MSSSQETMVMLQQLPYFIIQLFLFIIVLYFFSKSKNQASAMLLIASVLKIIGTVGMSYLTYTSIKNMGMHYEPSYFLSMMMSVLSILGNILFGLGLLLLINAYLKLKRNQQNFV